MAADAEPMDLRLLPSGAMERGGGAHLVSPALLAWADADGARKHLGSRDAGTASTGTPKPLHTGRLKLLLQPVVDPRIPIQERGGWLAWFRACAPPSMLRLVIEERAEGAVEAARGRVVPSLDGRTQGVHEGQLGVEHGGAR